MTGLFIKDLLNIQKYTKTLGIVLVIYTVWGVTMDNIDFFVFFIPLLFAMTVFNSFAFDDTAKWNEFAICFPIKRNHFIFSKYVFSFFFICVGNLWSIMFMIISSAVKKEPFQFMESVNIISGTFMISVFFISLMIPFIIKLGIEKSRIAIFGIFLLPSILIVGVAKLFPSSVLPSLAQIEHWIQLILSYLPIIAFLFCTISLAISCFISCHMFAKKEF